MDEQLTFEFEPRPTIKGFPELRWTGKRPYRSTQYYPAQLRESYGEEQSGWINKIFWGDNLQVMSHILKEYRGQIDLPLIAKRTIRKRLIFVALAKLSQIVLLLRKNSMAIFGQMMSTFNSCMNG